VENSTILLHLSESRLTQGVQGVLRIDLPRGGFGLGVAVCLCCA
jgi:hypothetical protein